MADGLRENGPAPRLSGRERLLMHVRIWLADRFQPGGMHTLLLWAALIGVAGAGVSHGFQEIIRGLHFLFTGHDGGIVASFQAMPAWRRIAVPVAGALLAGLVLYFGARFRRKGATSDYMEAVVVGDGRLPVKTSLVKTLSTLFSVASGGSIGREGALVQLSSLAASVIGRGLRFTLARQRQIVACGAAAGISSAYHAPVAGAFFVAEIVLGSLAIESFGPLVVASVAATLTAQALGESGPLYTAPAFAMGPLVNVVFFVGLGLVCGFLAPAYLSFLRGMEKLIGRTRLPLYARLMVGGLVVGLLAVYRPEVAGNGRSLVFGVLNHPGTWQMLAVVLVCKLLATGATLGSGAVGGVFTPTLFTGAALGFLFGTACAALFPGLGVPPAAFGMIGMGAFLAAATGAPIMAIIMIFELTLDYGILTPVMLAAVLSHSVSRSFTRRPLYADALERKGRAAVGLFLDGLKISDLMRGPEGTVDANAPFGEVVKLFLHSSRECLHAVENGRFLGVISLHDVKAFLDQPELDSLLIARDVMHADAPRLRPAQTVGEALVVFGETDAGSLPVTDAAGVLLGSVSKSDLLLLLAGKRGQDGAKKS